MSRVGEKTALSAEPDPEAGTTDRVMMMVVCVGKTREAVAADALGADLTEELIASEVAVEEVARPDTRTDALMPVAFATATSGDMAKTSAFAVKAVPVAVAEEAGKIGPPINDAGRAAPDAVAVDARESTRGTSGLAVPDADAC